MLQLPALPGLVSSTYMHRIGGELTALLAHLIIGCLQVASYYIVHVLYAHSNTAAQQRRECKGNPFSRLIPVLGSCWTALGRTGPRRRKVSLSLSALARGDGAFFFRNVFETFECKGASPVFAPRKMRWRVTGG
ncbi:hypothetical protein K445DRAFT_85734 [Daldinia sp. EC12]|nr:hypothetical protein K445DRAFT_85734 [Daldinia sp. EC12]